MPSKLKKLDYIIQLNRGSISKRRKSFRPLMVRWVNIQGNECKRIIQSNKCFCAHTYADHQYHFANEPHCKVPNCRCKCFEYIPHFDLKCLCRHSSKDHDILSKRCKMCKNCLGFQTAWACKCGFKYLQHNTVISLEDEAIKENQVLPSIKTSQGMIKHQCIQGRREFVEEEDPMVERYREYLRREREKIESEEAKKKIMLEKLNQKMQRMQDIIEGDVQLSPRKELMLDNTPLALLMTPHKYIYVPIHNWQQIANAETSRREKF